MHESLGEQSLDPTFFHTRSFADVTAIRLVSVFMNQHDQPQQAPVAFNSSLRKLVLWNFGSNTAQSPYAIFYCPNLLYLSLTVPTHAGEPFQPAAFQHFFNSVAHQLVHLVLILQLDELSSTLRPSFFSALNYPLLFALGPSLMLLLARYPQGSEFLLCTLEKRVRRRIGWIYLLLSQKASQGIV